MNKTNEISFKDKQEIFARLERVASQANLSEEDRARYEEEWKIYNDYFNTIESAKKRAAEEGKEEGKKEGFAEGRAEGKAEGLAEGEAIGRAEGEAIGRTEGKAEGLAEGEAKGKAEEQLKLAKGFKQAGTAIAIIAQVTGLSIEEIEAL